MAPEKTSKAQQKIEKTLHNVVALVRCHLSGIPLKKLSVFYSQKYHCNLTLHHLNFDSMANLVASCKDLLLEEEVVHHRDNRVQTTDGEDGEMSSSVSNNLVALIKEHPNGIPLKKISHHYSKKYHANIMPASLGFKSISNLIDSLKHDLVVVEQTVFHKKNLPETPSAADIPKKVKKVNQPATQKTLEFHSRSGSPTPYDPPTAFAVNTARLPSLSFGSSSFIDGVPTTKPTAKPVNAPSPAGGASHLSNIDFPPLESRTSSSKVQKSKVSDANQKDFRAPVFRDTYHAQLREVHRGNMQAVEAMEDDENVSKNRNRALDKDMINSLMENVIRDIATDGELVTSEKVISRVSRMIPSLDPGRLKPWNYPALKDLQYIIREINMFLECTEAVTSITTLYELGQSLAGLKDKNHYEELNLGPLCKLPLIHRMFKISSNTKDDDIQQIETVDVLKQIRVFRRKYNKPKLDLAEFLKYLSDHYNCDSPYELGIRIHSIGLPIATLKKVSVNEQQILDGARTTIQKELEEETLERLRKLKKSILDPTQGGTSFTLGGNADLRKKYISMTSAEVVLAVFTNASEVFTPRMTKHVQSFLTLVSGEPLTRALFQLAVCGGSLAVPQDLVLKDKNAKSAEAAKPSDKAGRPPPSEAKVKQFLKESLAAQKSAITFGHIAALERKLTKHFQVKDFSSIQQGTFMEFLGKNIQLLQDCLGSALFLGSNAELAGGSFRPTRQDVFEFIKHCGSAVAAEPDQLAHIESALRSHYRVRDSRELGYGSLQMLAGLVQRQKELGGGGLSPVFYESVLLAKGNKTSAENEYDCVGRLGDVSKSQALASLLSCPLLEDLNHWSQWELIFQPVQGPLKDFIERNAGSTGLAALEVTPGVLLRITTDTGDKHFNKAVSALDPVGTAGHLVSMVTADGVDDAPTALLANHMHTSLAAALAKEDSLLEEEGVARSSEVAEFLLQCLARIPTRSCQVLLQQVFLEPLSRELGQAKSKQVLMAAAQSDPKHLNLLHRLGILLGVTDWIKDYQKKLNPQQTQSWKPQTTFVNRSGSNLPDSESSSLSALNTSEDELPEDEDVADSSSASSRLSHSAQQVNGDPDVEVEEDEEQLYELTSAPNGQTSNVHSEADESHETSDSEVSESEKSEAQKPSYQKTMIENIRKSEFGVGVELTTEGQELMEKHQERLGRSLERLSTELYSKDTHFVLELIQNADDNRYPSEGDVVPALAFVVEKDCVTVLNNECGFREENIKAICDVGRSTKGKHTYGYIGQKGIGFKSVFKVTDRPEIHSNGFHLRFDKNCGPMGYILPHWTEDERPLDATSIHINQHSWNTKISLPLRSGSHQTRNLFHDVHPSLLLFLHRLRSITIYNQSEKRLVSMTRRDLSHDVLEVEHTDGIERWLVVKRTLQPKKIKEDVESTELALAFQLDGGTAEGEVARQPQKQPVFAYLPLRSFGFRFIVQGDFDIPSSREDVDRDSSWNQWLRSEIPQLFLQAMDVFADHPEFRGLSGLCQFLQFVPLPDEAMDFFKPVAGQIIQLLKGKAFLPALSSDGKVAYKLPSQVAICQDAVIRQVIGGEELEKHLSLSYLHPGLTPAPPASLLAHLGVRHLRGSDVTTVTTAMAKELVKADAIHSEDGLHQLARLLVCNFRAMEHGYGEVDSILQKLRDLPIIPLADGRVVALSGEGVFFPMAEGSAKKKKAKAQIGPLSALYKDVNVVHPSLLGSLEPLECQQVRELLKRLGVHELEPLELLEQHIYPTIKTNKWKSKAESVVVSYLVFIKQHASSSQDYANIEVPILTCRGLCCPATERIHFSQEYGNIDLQQKLPGCEWILVSPCYVQTDGDAAGWRELLGKLGVRDGLIIRKERRTLTPEELASSPWSSERQQNAAQHFVLDDFPCEEFHSLATASLPGSVLLKQRVALLELLETNWDAGHLYSQYLTAQVIDGDGQTIKNTKSSFHYFLGELPWLPAYRPLRGEQPERKYLRPSSVYLSSPKATALLGTHVDYVDLQSSEFSRALGMRESVSVEVLIEYLKKWCVDSEAFTSTVQHIHDVYACLSASCPQRSLKELFQQNPAVFVETRRLDENWCTGRFYHLKEVCWTDPTSMFQRYKQLTADSSVQQPKLLAPFYRQLDGMSEFFSRLLNVESSPTMKQYVDLLELICAASPIPNAEVLQDVSVLYARLAHKCKEQVGGEQENLHPKLNSAFCSTLKGMLADLKVLPTKENNWVSLARKPVISDDKDLEKIFKQHKQVCLLNLPPAEKRNSHRNKTDRPAAVCFSEKDRLLFLEICGVRLLSRCVKSEPVTENLRPCPSAQSTARAVVPYIQRFLFHHDELAEVYSELSDRNIADKIKRLTFGQVGKLYIRYELDGVIQLQDVVCLLTNEKELYIQKDHVANSQPDICRELVKLFCTESGHRKELTHFLIGLLASLHDSKALKRFLSKEDVGELPSEEQAWEVPEPERDFNLEKDALRKRCSISSPEEPPPPPDGEQTLACWPPRASLSNAGISRAGQAGSKAVEEVMKMWPQPAAPKEPEKEFHPRESGHDGAPPARSSSRPAEQRPPAASEKSSEAGSGGERPLKAAPPPAETRSEQPTANSPSPCLVSSAPEAVVISGSFQGTSTETQRPPLNLDVPLWKSTQATVEDLELPCQKPSTVVLTDDLDVAAIGNWGEQLVNSFLCQWKDSEDPGRPTRVVWCNQNGESGQPYDFQLGFGLVGAATVVYVEVKSTIKKEKSFIHLSANELDFALKEKERYHIFRVYSAGDAEKVRLCRIQNLAQHLHTKDLALYLFV